MTYWLEMKSNEIGEALGMAPSSVRVALKQARDRNWYKAGQEGDITVLALRWEG